MGVEDRHAKQYWKSRQAEWMSKKSLVCFGVFDAAGWSHESNDDLTRPERPSIA
jgi:hypothetical protein